MKPRILVVDDEQPMCELLEADLARHGYSVTWRTTPEEALLALNSEDFDVVLTDLQMRGMSGLDLCDRVVTNRPEIPVIVVTAFGSLDTAIAAIRTGAYDFVTKPFQTDTLVLALERAIRHRDLKKKVKLLSRAVAEAQRFDELIGSSPAMKQLYDLLSRLAGSDASILISGESGTGKELVARSLHQRSPRSTGPFVPLNCAAVAETLLESELFGHVKGAYTDAKTARRGLFLQAAGGTLFLDEIADMPMPLQPKLLRALEDRRIRPVGSDEELAVDVRIMSATNRDLESAVEEGRFRQDLFFRINVVRIELPPLRARGADILLLAQHYLEHFAACACKPVKGLSRAAAERLLVYRWPGNVRELRNCMEQAVILTRFDEIAVDDLPERVRAYRPTKLLMDSDNPAELVSMEELERRYIAQVLQAAGGNKNLAARILGFDRKTLYRKLERYQLPETHPG